MPIDFVIDLDRSVRSDFEPDQGCTLDLACSDGLAPAGLSVYEFRTPLVDIRSQMSRQGRDANRLEALAACRDANEIDGYRRKEEAGIGHLIVQPWSLHFDFDTTSLAPLEVMADHLNRFSDESFRTSSPTRLGSLRRPECENRILPT